MSKQGSWLAAALHPDCEFELKMNEPLPDDQTIANSYDCESKEFLDGTLSPASCFASVEIDYDRKDMKIKFANVDTKKRLIDPYNDMLILYPGVDDVTQYKIIGNLQKHHFQLITRIECHTDDNCALEQLRDMLPDLLETQRKLKIFQRINERLNKQKSSSSSNIQCVNSMGDLSTCATGSNRCSMELKDKSWSRDCVLSTGVDNDVFEFRFNVKAGDTGSASDADDSSTKSNYVCEQDGCNSVDAWKEVDKLVHEFVRTSSSSSSSSNSHNSSAQKPKPRPSPHIHNATSRLSSYYWSMIICMVLFQMFLN